MLLIPSYYLLLSTLDGNSRLVVSHQEEGERNFESALKFGDKCGQKMK